MIKSKPFLLFVVFSILLAACTGPAGAPAVAEQGNTAQPTLEAVQSVPTAESSSTTSSASAEETHSGADHHSDVDLTHLEVGDGKYSTSPQVGYVYSCMTSFNGGGASGIGSWMNGDGTWDATKKAVVDGSVTWPGSFTVSIQGDQRVFTGNDLPKHPTGAFPIDPSDDAYAVDRNPNSIQEQSITLSLPVTPTAAVQPNCVGGEIGIMLSGVVIFSAFDAGGRDAVATEVQDNCDGHPQVSGFYHYHSLSDCIKDTATSGHSSLVGYAFDSYGIYGYYGEDGKEITNEDLDACHGHTHVVEWDGQMVEMYHYHATHEFPYVVGCFHGDVAVHTPPSSGGGMGGGQQGGQGNGQQPPQAAIDACVGLTQDMACTVTTPNGTLNGTCMMPPSSTQLACVPIGGPPSP